MDLSLKGIELIEFLRFRIFVEKVWNLNWISIYDLIVCVCMYAECKLQ